MLRLKHIKSRKLLWTALFLLVTLGAAILLYFWLQPSPNENTIGDTPDSRAESTSRSESAANDFKDGDDRPPRPATDKKEGYLTDNTGTIPTIPPSNEWTTSSSSSLTIYAPSKNQLLRDGATVSGTAAQDLDKVSFRLIDNVSGVIAQGTIGVVDGRFSGTLHFTTSASEGRLDLFTSDTFGKESNVIEIPVRL